MVRSPRHLHHRPVEEYSLGIQQHGKPDYPLTPNQAGLNAEIVAIGLCGHRDEAPLDEKHLLDCLLSFLGHSLHQFGASSSLATTHPGLGLAA